MVIDIGLERRNTLEHGAWRVTSAEFGVFQYSRDIDKDEKIFRPWKSDEHAQLSKMRAKDYQPCLYEWEIDNYLIN